MSAGIQNVHVRVNDAETGKPTAVRVRFVGPDGKYYAPFGRLTRFGTGPAEDVGGNLLLGEKRYAYIDGACEIRLPVGQIEVEIHKGPEYVPVHEKIELKKGKLSMRFEIRRWIDTRSRGWYSGDTHCSFLSPHAALLEGAAEDLQIVNLLARYTERPTIPPGYVSPVGTHPEFSNILAFSGQEPALETPDCTVVVNTLNFSEKFGTLALLNCHRIVFPLIFGVPVGPSDWTLADWCEQCHRKGGLVVAIRYGIRGEVLADAVLGHIDAIAADLPNEVRMGYWRELLDCGMRIPLAGGSDKWSNRDLLGAARTYAKVTDGQAFTYKNWIEAIRKGQTFVSNGPVLFFSVNGQDPGAVLDVDESSHAVHLHAQAKSIRPIKEIEIYYNGTLVAAASANNDGPIWIAEMEQFFEIHEPGYFYARCHAGMDNEQVAYAITSPIHIQLAGKNRAPHHHIVHQLLERLEKAIDWVRKIDDFENDQQRHRMESVYLQAQEKLRRMLA